MMDDATYSKRLKQIRPKLVRYVLVSLGPDDRGERDHAEDIVQDALLDLWRYRDNFDSEVGTFERWAIVHTIGALRRYWNRTSGEIDPDVPEGWEPAVPSGDPTRYTELHRALEALAEADGGERLVKIIRWYYWQGQTDPEIGEQLEVSKQRVHQLRSKAERILREELGVDPDTEVQDSRTRNWTGRRRG